MLWDSHLLSFELWLGLKRFSSTRGVGETEKVYSNSDWSNLVAKKKQIQHQWQGTQILSLFGHQSELMLFWRGWVRLFSHGICLTNDFAHKTSNVFSCFVTRLRDMWGCWAWKLSVRSRGYLGNVRAEYNNTLVGVASALNLGLSLVGSPPCQPYLAVLLSSECSMLSLSQLDL